MIKEGIQKLINKENLKQDEMEIIFTEIMQGESTAAQIACFITALRLKGETVDEITGAAAIMRKFAVKLKINARTVLDTCGTGGSCKHTFNVSTMAAFVASGAGVTIAKHGNRSVSSKSGSADILEKLGVNICAHPEVVERCINEIGIGFLFAPTFHEAMKYAIGPRREIGIRTIFNILGPLTNPANATHQLVGVFDGNLIEPIARVLGNLGVKHALVVYGRDGVDEISLSAETLICENKEGIIKKYSITPEQFGFKRIKLEALQVNSVEESVNIAEKLFAGEPGPIQDFVVLNSGFALYAADMASSPEEGIKLAKISLGTGKAKEKLNLLVRYANEISA
ncbi:MAG: anthranilate phosphoribosyltransferase [Candidatus Omnitrophica bacterium]|nr:anthranilate phosphoribosyltransferase [Candidatus Omnitrophota bacterium]